MAKKCAVRVLGWLLPGFFVFQRLLLARPGAIHKMFGLWAPGYTLGLDARRRLPLETFSSSDSELACIDSICRRKV
jgi:hypothetical protein